MKRNFLFPFAILLFAIPAIAQDQADSTPENPRIVELSEQLTEAVDEFRTAVREAQRLGFQYVNAETFSDAIPFSDEFYDKIKQGNVIRERLIPIAIELFNLKMSGTDRAEDQLVHLVTNIMKLKFDRGEYSQAYELSQKLTENNPENEFAKLYVARAGMLTNDFGTRVESIIRKHREFFDDDDSEEVSDTEKMLIANFKVMRELFKKELGIRKTEAAADDLPRVNVTTTKGEFVIELFENEAPQTVANFISLVESGHYDGMLFHTVIDKTAAETGVLMEDGKVKQLDYTIYDEFSEPDARMNFAGTVSLNSENANSGCSRFFVSLAPLPSFNNKQTVFGRVLTGLDTVYRLNHTYKIEGNTQIKIEDVKPDRVISAKVIRKRDHSYEPIKVEK